MKLEQAIERVIDRCNLIGEDADVYKIMFQYKAIRELSWEEIDQVYNKVVQCLGFCW